MREITWAPEADQEYREICSQFPRVRQAVDGALTAIGIAGHSRPFVPNSDQLRVQTTRKGAGVPSCGVYFMDVHDEDCWRIMSVVTLGPPGA